MDPGSQVSSTGGDDIVLLHGFPFSQTMWAPLVQELDGLTVLTPDLPGAGGSGAPSGYGSLEVCAGQMMRFLDTKGVDRVILGGLSMGGYVAFEMFRRHRDRFSALILMNTKSDADDPAGRAARDQAIEAVRTRGPAEVADSMMPKLLPQDADPGLQAQVREMMHSSDAFGMVYALEAMRDRRDSTGFLSTIDVPTLVIAGSDDRITPAGGMKAMADQIPNSTFVEIPGAGHLTPIEKPGEVAGAIRNWSSAPIR